MKNRFSKLLLYMKPFVGLSILSAVISTLVAWGNAAPVWLVEYLIDDVLVNKDQKMLLFVCVGMLGITILKGLGSFYRIYLQSYISGRMIKNMREDLYKKVIASSHNFFHEVKLGDILTRFSSDLVMVQGVVESSFKLLIEVIYVLLLLMRLLHLNWKLSMVCIIVVPLSGRLIRKFVKKLRRTGKGIQESLADLNSRLQEVLNGINVIKSFATEDYEFNKFKVKSDENYKLTLKNRKTNAKIRPIMEFFNILSVTIVAYYGGTLVINGKMTPGELMSFLSALAVLATPIKKITQMVGEIQTKSHSIDRVYDILESEDYIKEKSDAKELEEVNGEIHFNALNFSYPSEENLVLKNINLDIKAGEMIAFVGKSGSGKSTLVSLLPRFYDINSGEIKIDDVDIKDLTIKSLRQKIGIVPQETVLFSGTIYENISYGTTNISNEEVIEAAKMANAYNFINELPNGFETEVGEKGLKLSGGQKQRIAIARALIQNPRILILDEATSALDTESEKLVQNALEKLMEKRTSLVIAHRLSTILHADKIVVMADGEVKEIGTNEELLKQNGIYKKLYDTQFENV